MLGDAGPVYREAVGVSHAREPDSPGCRYGRSAGACQDGDCPCLDVGEPTAAGSSLWIECPHCEGSAGWYGCANCACVLSRDEPPTSDLCPRCQAFADCEANGGHAFGGITHDHRGGFERSCACGQTRRVWKVRWDGKRYVDVETESPSTDRSNA
jgi:hypothetical protein